MRLLLFGLALVTAVAALQEYSRSAQRPQRERLSNSLKNAALTAFIFGIIAMLFGACVTPTVGVVAHVLGYERRRELDARQHRALARLVELGEIVVEPPIRNDPAARAAQVTRQAKAEKERARVWERFVKGNAVKILPRWFTQGEAYVLAALPLLFYVWVWTRKDEPVATAPGGRQVAATTPKAPRGPKPPALSRGQAMELWFWCWAAAAERERRIDPGYPTPVVGWQVSACLRIQAAFERLHQDGGCRASGGSDPLENRLARGLDAAGVVLFNRYLVQQRRFWKERASAGSEEEREEAEIRASVVEAASRVFLRIVGATSAAIERGAAALPLATDPRRLRTGLRMGGVVICDEATEGPIPPEEEEPRWAEAIRRVNAAGGGLKS
jgi:hypothetical protein